MHLIAPIVSGITGASDGFVRLYRRGTATRATWYPDFEATSNNASGTDIPLDSNGGATIYVDELVDVSVYDSTGELVRGFTAGDAAPAVEVISPSFTGTSYADGSTGAGKPTTLQAALDLLATSFGTTNFKVLVGGVATLLTTALASVPSYINVKSPTYGAVGDGVTDDTAALNAAIAAAGSAGTLFFPAGTYKISTGLTLGSGVNLLGASSGVIILMTHATQNALTFTGEGSVLQNITVQMQTGKTGDCLRLSTTGAWLTLYSCSVLSDTGACVSTPGAGLGNFTKVRAYDTFFQKANSNTNTYMVQLVFTDTRSEAEFFGCQFKVPVAFAATNEKIVRMTYGSLSGCSFDMCGNASGTHVAVAAPTVEVVGRTTVVSGCTFTAAGAGGTIIYLQSGANNSIFDAGNNFGTSGTIYSGVPTATTSGGAALTAIQGMEALNWASGDLPANFHTYSHLVVHATFNWTAAPNTIALGANIQPGRRILITLWNNSGGSRTSAAIISGVAHMFYSAGMSLTIADGNAATYEVVFAIVNGSLTAIVKGYADNFGPV